MYSTYSNETINLVSKRPSIQPQLLEDNTLSSNLKPISLLQAVLEGFIDGILILTEQGECLHANHCARRIWEQLSSGNTPASAVPAEIWHVCESLIESRDLFPNQKMIIESEISKSESVAFRVRVRWLKLEQIKRPCLLVTLEDRYQSIQRMVTTDVHKYGLTPREAEVWLLYRANYSYKEIADELFITLNTVKKHMKNIHAKRKAICNFDLD